MGAPAIDTSRPKAAATPGAGGARWLADIVGPRASVQPLAGWLLTLLVAFVAWLSFHYSRSFEADADDGAGAGVIPLAMGYWVLGGVTLVALVVAFETHLIRWLSALARPLVAGTSGWRTWLDKGRQVLWGAPSVLLSALDTLLARVIAGLVGATQASAPVRYGWGATVILSAITVGLLAPPPWGLAATALGLVAVIAIVRRWSWVEADRDTYLIERGARDGAMRVGFEEDLRTEALLAIVCLFLLLPLLLRQVQLATCADGGVCAFAFRGGYELPDHPLQQMLAWLGYFGAELAKAVPFVDWSEVFHVENNSPIAPRTALGAQVVFVMRAMLDLMLLAAVVQAVGIASRIREQNDAFWNHRLPILEPFTERRILSQLGGALDPALELRAADMQAVRDFPDYEGDRLQELIEAPKGASIVRAAALALLAAKHEGRETTDYLLGRASTEADADVRAWMQAEALGLTFERADANRAKDIQQLTAMLKNRAASPGMRAAAARRLGRVGAEETPLSLLQEIAADEREAPAPRAHALVALAKLAPSAETASVGERLVEKFQAPAQGAELVPVMATAYALARLAPTQSADAIAARFPPAVQEHAKRAALIQAAPLAPEAARQREIGVAMDQMVRLPAGSFLIGAPSGLAGARPDQFPQTEITMRESYALARFPTTNREYRGYLSAMGLPLGAADGDDDAPVVNIVWRDGRDYAIWLESFTGERYRLPSEAEWEYACRAGTATRYWWSDEPDEKRIPGTSAVSRVNALEPNPWGLWDLYGNVYEWCADTWHPSHEGRPRTDEPWLADGDHTRRVVRAGSWSFPTGERRRELGSAYRNERALDSTATNVGFRLARSLSA